jgi:NAD(P)-dependent dehydrogenase (short-subunit alcohol dehydrogenase family)
VDIHGRTALILGGYGLVGMAVCRELMSHQPKRLVVASLRQDQAERAVELLGKEFPKSETEIVPAWGDLLLRAEWQEAPPGQHPRTAVLSDPARRRRLVKDILEELDDDILNSSLLFQLITGKACNLDGQPAEIVIDCVNTATAVAYQNIYQTARRLETLIDSKGKVDWPDEVERLLASLYVPQLVRHIQIFYEAMLHANTEAYIKVGTSGTGGMGLNIPYTHGEEKPSRVLLSKSAVAGAQTMLIFLLGRTPGGPTVVKEIKPTAAIAWKEIDYGTIRSGGREFPLYDCPLDEAVSVSKAANLAAEGDFGLETGKLLESVYIDTGENGLFALGEFSAITTLGQMEFVTPEEIAQEVIRELRGGSTGHDIVAGLDATVMGPSYRAGFLRQSAIHRMQLLESEHGVDSIAFELLGPPRLSKLLFEAYLLKRISTTITGAINTDPGVLSRELDELISSDELLRQQIISVGIPILLSDGNRLLRGPVNKSPDAENGWVDFTAGNMRRWQDRLGKIREAAHAVLEGPSSSQSDRTDPSTYQWKDLDAFDVGEIVGWIFIHEEEGRRGKA